MADNAFNWAANNKLLRKNDVHGEEEARLVLKDTFAWSKTEGERNEERSSMEVDDTRLGYTSNTVQVMPKGCQWNFSHDDQSSWGVRPGSAPPQHHGAGSCRAGSGQFGFVQVTRKYITHSCS